MILMKMVACVSDNKHNKVQNQDVPAGNKESTDRLEAMCVTH